jgi:phenylacetate-coenzyme A ligase PaaK-like adenylate-forming protein
MQVTPLENWIVQRAQLNQKSQNALDVYQVNEIQKIVRYAKEKSRFYQEALKNIDVDSIKSLEDFERIPFTTPADIKRAAYDFLCVGVQEIERIVTLNTSGTTGDEKRIFFTHEDLEATIDFFQYGMSCLVDENDCVMVLLPGPAYGSIGDLLKSALKRSGIKCVVHGVLQDIEKTTQCIEVNNITCIVGIPMQVRYLRLMKPELFYRFIKKVLLSTDYVPNSLVKALSKEGKCQVFNHYGMTEMGYGGGVECECLDGYHLRENHLYFEIINPKTGELVEDGEYGEVVFTTLNRQAMPLIRYKTGDMARFYTQPCECGSFLRRMQKVIGRIDNLVSIDGCEVHLRDLDEIILDIKEVADFKAEILEKNVLHVKLILLQNSEIEAVLDKVQERISKHFNNQFKIQLQWQFDDYSSSITNSMIKRKICDFTKGEKR